MNSLHQAARRLERLEALDNVAKPLAGRSTARCGRAWCATCSAALTWGILLHPMLTDLPIGVWVMSALLDAGGPAAEGAAYLLATAGVVAAMPTAAAGCTAGPTPPGRRPGSGWCTPR